MVSPADIKDRQTQEQRQTKWVKLAVLHNKSMLLAQVSMVTAEKPPRTKKMRAVALG